MTNAQDRLPADDTAVGAATFARAWFDTLQGAGYVAMTPHASQRFLLGLSQRLAAGARPDPLDPATGYQLGVDLVSAGFASPETLGRTIGVINAGWVANLGHPADSARLSRLVEALAAGFVSAVRGQTLDAQEAIRVAALRAQVRAEQALRESEARLRYAASHDSLTDLPNRALFTEQLAHLLAGAVPGHRLGDLASTWRGCVFRRLVETARWRCCLPCRRMSVRRRSTGNYPPWPRSTPTRPVTASISANC
jgi:hypothetical protein